MKTPEVKHLYGKAAVGEQSHMRSSLRSTLHLRCRPPDVSESYTNTNYSCYRTQNARRWTSVGLVEGRCQAAGAGFFNPQGGGSYLISLQKGFCSLHSTPL